MYLKKLYILVIALLGFALGAWYSTPLFTRVYAADEANKTISESTIKIDKVKYFDIAHNFVFTQEGQASWYGRQFHNRKTSNGERFNMFSLSAAHRNLPFGSIIRVTNLDNNKTSLIRVNDRGPFIRSKIVDLSYFSAGEIGGYGNPEVKIESLQPNDYLFINKEDNEYYFGYSFELPLVCLPANVIKFLDSSDDFDEAVQIFKEYSESYPNQFVYLMMEASGKKHKFASPDQITYYIGLFDSNDIKLANETE